MNTEHDPKPSAPVEPVSSEPTPKAAIPYVPLALSGLFMGLANLVPGVSGGTMILVLGMYDEFIEAFSDITRLKITVRSLIVLAILFGIAAVTVFGFASGIQYMMEMFMPGMLGLFIGMTLGGAPLLYREIKPLKVDTLVPCVIAIVLMALLAFVFRVDFSNPGFLLFFVGGVVGSAAMILPGISGSYILLILGLYLPIIGGLSAFKDALSSRDVGEVISLGTNLVLPIGLGLVVGLALLTNVLKFLLTKYHRPTIGFLLGLLLGSVFGLYPFKEPSFQKLPRYALDGTLHVYGYGWADNETSVVSRNLRLLEEDGYVVNVLVVEPEQSPDEDAVRTASSVQGIIVAYDQSPANSIRRLAENAEPHEVHLEVVPNTEFSVVKGIMVVVLMLIGFGLTFALGMLDPKRKSRSRSRSRV